jgi:hypothetical protein
VDLVEKQFEAAFLEGWFNERRRKEKSTSLWNCEL